MKCILVDPARMAVELHDNDGSLEAIRKLLDDVPLGHEMLLRADEDGHSEMAWLDDNGLYRPNQSFTKINGHEYPWPGKFVIYGVKGEDHCDTNLTVAIVRANIEWANDLEYAGSTVEEHQREFLGKPMTVIKETPHFRKKGN